MWSRGAGFVMQIAGTLSFIDSVGGDSLVTRLQHILCCIHFDIGTLKSGVKWLSN